MSGNRNSGAAVVPPHAQLVQMGTAYWVSRMVYAAAKFALADRVADGPKSAAELAQLTRGHEPSLHRLLRALASLGILSEDDGGRLVRGPLGGAVKTGAPGSARATVVAPARGGRWRARARLLWWLVPA